MKRLLLFLLVCAIYSCKDETVPGKFTVNGKVENLPDQKVYLEEVYFTDKAPLILDTAEVKNGVFTVSGIAPEQGLFRLRMEKGAGYLFINDRQDISFVANASAQTLQNQSFNTPATNSLKNFLIMLDSLQAQLITANTKVEEAKQSNQTDSIQNVYMLKFQTANQVYQNFLLKYIDTTTSPVTAIFALGYAENLDQDAMTRLITGVSKRFPEHTVLNDMVKQYTQDIADLERTQKSITVGSVAPDLTMPDTEGKPFSLSSLKGKYVLVDFWASWCGPCRSENPNVVNAYKKYSNRNFTILGVSLDKDKSEWVNAIAEDGLTWKQISDLQFWKSAAVPLYNIESIPYNVLLDPQGKVIATGLREGELHSKLEELLPK